VGGTVWVLESALGAVSEVVVAAVTATVGGDMAAAQGGSRCGMGGWGLGWAAVDGPGKECRHFRIAAGRFDGGGTLVAVVNGVDSHDMAVWQGVYIVGRDVAGSGAGWGLGTVGLGGSVDAMGVPVDVPASLSGRSGSSWSAVCVTASMVQVGVIWVQESIGMLAVDPVCTPLLTWIHVCGLTHLPWPCFISHASRSAVFPFSYASLPITSLSSFPSSSPVSWPSLQPFSYARSSACFVFSSSSFPSS
jgi:hypothetical protein